MYYSYQIGLLKDGFRPYKYTPIHIKWDGGYMDICPPALFEETLSKFRKVAKLSAESDLTMATHTIREWRRDIKHDNDFIFRLNTELSGAYSTEYERISQNGDLNEKERHSKLKRLINEYNSEIKKLDQRRKHMKKCVAILDKLAAKYE